MFTQTGFAVPGQVAKPLAREEAFVLTNAIAGVMRSLATGEGQALERGRVEDALVRLVLGYVDK